MKVISLHAKQKKHRRGERKSPKEMGETTGKALWFERAVNCKICGKNTSETDLGTWSILACSMLDTDETKLVGLYENGWHRVEIKPRGWNWRWREDTAQYYLCAECKGRESLF